ncbi:MAG: Na+/H+ antiporter subunit E [Candidatus Moduliflexus flocculans]|nr:Na+/H+ antiporter subunit E [Candidatus Moduliflexus flocculans]
MPLFIVYLALTGNARARQPGDGRAGGGWASACSAQKMDSPPLYFQRPACDSCGRGYATSSSPPLDVIRGGISDRPHRPGPEPAPEPQASLPSPAGSLERTRHWRFPAHAITLSPGEMVVAIDDEGVMYTHCLNVDDSEKWSPTRRSCARTCSAGCLNKRIDSAKSSSNITIWIVS